jgi:hypothetical protein
MRPLPLGTDTKEEGGRLAALLSVAVLAGINGMDDAWAPDVSPSASRAQVGFR